MTCLKLADWIKSQLTVERSVQKDVLHMATARMIQYKFIVCVELCMKERDGVTLKSHTL